MKLKKQVILIIMALMGAAALFFQNYALAKSKISLNQRSLSMTVGGSSRLKLNGISSKEQKKVSWKSSAPATASVTKRGKVSAKKAGDAVITASYKRKKYSCRIQVAAGTGPAVGEEKESEGSMNEIMTMDELRDGSSADTVGTPDDFPQEYDYGSGQISGWSGYYMSKKLPEPKGNETVLNTAADPSVFQALYLWEEGNAPAVTLFTENMTGYFDEWDFRPYVTAVPMRDGMTPKGAVLLMAGGAYQCRGNYTDALTTAAALREYGFQTFVVDYRLQPYSQEEGALDVARAVRFVRKNADRYGFHPDHIAVMGFSAGGIQAGEFLMHYDEDVDGTALDASYVPDELDKIPAHASADGMIYSFYGRLSVGNMDPEWLAGGNLPPTFYVYGTEDPFYRQFERQYQVIKDMGIPVSRIVLDGWPHGFGSDGGWVRDYADWLESVFKKSTVQ